MSKLLSFAHGIASFVCVRIAVHRIILNDFLEAYIALAIAGANFAFLIDNKWYNGRYYDTRTRISKKP